jgi:hypothetical protein
MTPEAEQKATDRIAAFTWWNKLTKAEIIKLTGKSPWRISGIPWGMTSAEIEQLYKERTK